MILVWLVGCGPDLPHWTGELGVPVLESDAAQIRFSEAAEPVRDALIARGWVEWHVVDEVLHDSHRGRFEKDAVWADLRVTETGSRLLRLDGPPERQAQVPVPLARELGDPAHQLTLASGCSTADADLRFHEGSYVMASGAKRSSGEWTVDGDALVMAGPLTRRCESVQLFGGSVPQVVTCGGDPFLWCGRPAGPLIELVDAGGGPDRLAAVGAILSRPLDGSPLVVVREGPARDGVTITGGAGLAYRLRRDLAEPVRFSAGTTGQPVRVEVGPPGTVGPK